MIWICLGRWVIATCFIVPPFLCISVKMKSDSGCQEQVTASKSLWNICLQIRGKGFVTLRSLVVSVINESGYEFQNKDETKFSYIVSRWSTWYYSSGLRVSTPDAKRKKYGNVWEYSRKKWVLLLLRERSDIIPHTVWKGLFEETFC